MNLHLWTWLGFLSAVGTVVPAQFGGTVFANGRARSISEFVDTHASL